ncbi:MAG: N4-gp56 family major capsid protein [Clostridia bacterium]|nr:N4-gp56 family major capsid protein [Clostridia bacterium]
MNLRLFDVSFNATTDSGLSAENKTFYEKVLLKATKPNLVHNQFGQKRRIPKRGGKSIEWRRFSTLPKATTALTEGVTPTGQKYSVTTVTGTVSQYGDYVGITDMVDMTAIDNNIVEVTEALGNQAGLTLDTVTRNELVAGTNVMYAPAGDTAVNSRANLTANSLLTVPLVYKAVNLLKRMNVPKINGDYVCILHPDVGTDFQLSDGWIEAHKYATPENIYQGEIGKIAGCRFVESSEAVIWKGTGCPTGLAVYGCIFLGADAYGVVEIEGGGLEHIFKPLGSGDDPLNQRCTAGWKATSACKRLAEERIVRVECCSSNSANATAN